MMFIRMTVALLLVFSYGVQELNHLEKKVIAK